MRKFILAGLLTAIACLAPAYALSVLPVSLDELIDTSAVAFEGTCVDNRSARDPATGLPVTYTTFEVRDVLKGDVGRTHVIKQVGGALENENLTYRVQGVPTFTPGEDYVVFLAGVSAQGFSSPMGLGQGRFTVHSRGGVREAGNGSDLRETVGKALDRMPEHARQKFLQGSEPVRELDVEDLKDTVRNYQRGAR